MARATSEDTSCREGYEYDIDRAWRDEEVERAVEKRGTTVGWHKEEGAGRGSIGI